MHIEYIAAISSLIGAAIGAAASIVTTALANKHGSKVAKANRESERIEKIKSFQFDNYIRIQECGLQLAHSMVQLYLQLKKQYIGGVSCKDLRISDEDDEFYRQCIEDFVFCEERITSDSLRNEARRLRIAAGALMHDSPDLIALEQSQESLMNIYSEFADKIGDAIREAQSIQWYVEG